MMQRRLFVSGVSGFSVAQRTCGRCCRRRINNGPSSLQQLYPYSCVSSWQSVRGQRASAAAGRCKSHHPYYYSTTRPVQLANGVLDNDGRQEQATSNTIRRFAAASASYEQDETTSEETDDSHDDALSSSFDSSSSSVSGTEQQQVTYDDFCQLAQEIRRHDDLYYNQQSSSTPESELLTDDEYDALVEREASYCVQYPHYLTRYQHESGLGRQATRFGGRVGALVSEAATSATTVETQQQRQHGKPMLSLQNVHSTEQLLQWLERIRKQLLKKAEAAVDATSEPVVATSTGLADDGGNNNTTSRIDIVTEPKLDGLSLSLRYSASSVEQEREDDRNKTLHGYNDKLTTWTLQWAATRGDGRQGQDVTQAVAFISGIPSSIQINNDEDDYDETMYSSIVEVRGEVIMPTSAFQQVKTNFSNARNAASGILLRKQNTSTSKKKHNNDDDNEDNNTRPLSHQQQQLQSLLRFYAYDIVLVENSDNNGDSSTATTDTNTTSMHSENSTAYSRALTNGVQMRSLLSKWGFDVPTPVQVSTLQLDNDTEWKEQDVLSLLHYYQGLERHRLKDGSKSSSNNTRNDKQPSTTYDWGDYEMDGVVHKLSQLDLRTMLGSTNRSPRWAVAHKFPAETALTSLLGLDVQVGRTGALTPVAVLEPVDISGVIVQRATLHNFGFLQQLMNGTSSVPVGTKVLVRRAGDVIPQVVKRVLLDTNNDKENDNEAVAASSDMISLMAPSKCPACGSPTRVVETTTANANSTTPGQVVRCDGPPLSCPPRAVGALAHAFSRDALDAKGLSEARIEQLMNAGFLRRPADLFQLATAAAAGSNSSDDQELLSRIVELPGWGTKSAQNLATVASRIATRGVSLSRFIYSLGIRHAGQHTSKLLSSTYGNVDAFLSAVEEVRASGNETAFGALVGSNETEGAKGIGPAQIASLVSFAMDTESVQAARDLATAVPIHNEVVDTAEAMLSERRPWEGFTVVFTGSLPNGMSRKDAQDVARRLGAKSTPGRVSKSTNLVIAGEKGGKKLEQALEMGVQVMDGPEFVDFVEAADSPVR